MMSRNQRHGKIDIVHQFLGRASLPGIVAGRLDAAGRATSRFESRDIVTLPAVHRNRDALQGFNGLFGVHANLGVLALSLRIAHDCSSPSLFVFVT